jgi:hypothetical protein
MAIAGVEQARATVFRKPPLLTPGTVKILESDWPLDSGPAQRDLGYRSRPLLAGLTATIAALTSGAGSVKSVNAPDDLRS